MTDAADPFEFLLEEIDQGTDSFPVQMRRYLALAKVRFPHSAWEALEQFDWGAELTRLASWLGEQLEEIPPAPRVNGFHFGLSQLAQPIAFDLYVAGHHVAADDAQWPGTEPLWEPTGRYAGSQALALIEEITYDPSSRGHHELYVPLSTVFATLAAGALACEVDTALWLRGEASCVFSAGWDGGDICQLGTLEQEGFTPDFQGLF